MRVTVDLLSGDGETHVRDADGVVCTLWIARLAWHCADRPLDLRVVASTAIELPACEPSEPVPSAIARVLAAIRGSGAQLLLANPALALGRERIGLAEGVRLFAIANAADEACWDAMLSLGQPVYGVRGVAACSVRSGSATSLLSALAYGLYTCEEGLTLAALEEDRGGIAIEMPPGCDGDAAVVVRGGFEAARLSGHRLNWRDLGSEGYVRLAISARDGDGRVGRCWTQPRFVAPGAAHV